MPKDMPPPSDSTFNHPVFIADGASPLLQEIISHINDVARHFPEGSDGEDICGLAKLDVIRLVEAVNHALPPKAARFEIHNPSLQQETRAPFSREICKSHINRLEAAIGQLGPYEAYMKRLGHDVDDKLQALKTIPEDLRRTIETGRFSEPGARKRFSHKESESEKWRRLISKTITEKGRARIDSPRERVLLANYCDQVLSVGEGYTTEAHFETMHLLNELQEKGLLTITPISQQGGGMHRFRLNYTEAGMSRCVELLKKLDDKNILFLPESREEYLAGIEDHIASTKLRIMN